MTTRKMLEADFEVQDKNKGTVTVAVSCFDVIGEETVNLCIQFYDDTMTLINYNYDKQFMLDMEREAIARLTEVKNALIEEEMEQSFNWHGGES